MYALKNSGEKNQKNIILSILSTKIQLGFMLDILTIFA